MCPLPFYSYCNFVRIQNIINDHASLFNHRLGPASKDTWTTSLGVSSHTYLLLVPRRAWSSLTTSWSTNMLYPVRPQLHWLVLMNFSKHISSLAQDTVRNHAIACSCARTLIYWSVFQSTIVRLFACYTERNVNQCFLNGSVVRQWTCSTKRYEREKERDRERERESEREASERVCADSTVHPSYVYAKTTNAICIYILPNYIYCLYICIGYIYIIRL